MYYSSTRIKAQSLDAVHTLNTRILSEQSESLDYMGATVKHNQSKVLKELLVQ